MIDKQGLAEKIRESVSGQEPSWKNALSRAAADSLSPKIPLPTPTPEPTPPPTVEDVPSEQELLAEKRRQVIERFNQLNQESLRAGNGRIGYLVGEGVGEAFILCQPVDEDVIVHNDQRNEDDLLRRRYYVAFTHQGVRAIVLEKGVVINGEIQLVEGKTLDERYQTGEHNLRYLLEQHCRFENENGIRPDNYGYFENPRRPITYEYAGGYPGLMVDQGREMLVLGVERWSSIDGPSPAKLITDVPESIVTQTVARSVESARVKREITPTPAMKEIDLLDKVMSATT